MTALEVHNVGRIPLMFTNIGRTPLVVSNGNRTPPQYKMCNETILEDKVTNGTPLEDKGVTTPYWKGLQRCYLTGRWPQRHNLLKDSLGTRDLEWQPAEPGNC